jgi:hypothetical protein
MEVNFHKEHSSKKLDVATGTLMDKVRLKLDGFMTAEDRFLKWSSDKNIQGRSQLSTDVEQYLSIENMIQGSPQGNNISISKPGAKDAFFSGIRKDYFADRHLRVQVVKNLNPADGSAAANDGKMAPILLSNVISTDPNVQLASNREESQVRMVICEKGTVIQFNIESWAAAAYGYAITSERIEIAPDLYITATEGEKFYSTSLQRFQLPPGNTIVVDSVKDIQKSFPGAIEVADVSFVRIKSWRVTNIKFNGKTYTSSLNPPKLKGGDFVFGKESVESAAPHDSNKPSSQNFVTISDVVEDRNDTLGDMTLIFYVFKDRETALRVVEVLNQEVFST